MTYRANKIRSAVEQKFSEGWNAGLDPEPYQCAMVPGARRANGGGCDIFAPRPEFEQNRSKYEH